MSPTFDSADENQLKLDLIDEEENIDGMMNESHNFWSKDLAQNEKNYER